MRGSPAFRLDGAATAPPHVQRPPRATEGGCNRLTADGDSQLHSRLLGELDMERPGGRDDRFCSRRQSARLSEATSRVAWRGVQSAHTGHVKLHLQGELRGDGGVSEQLIGFFQSGVFGGNAVDGQDPVAYLQDAAPNAQQQQQQQQQYAFPDVTRRRSAASRAWPNLSAGLSGSM